MNETPRSSRIHIALLGRRNAGKSSVINALTGQDISIVSDIKGTTTDPVYKAMELFPIGPVVFIDTAGLDDDSELGGQRVKKTYDVLNKSDIALLVCDESGIGAFEEQILDTVRKKNIPVIIVLNKSDIAQIDPGLQKTYETVYKTKVIPVSVVTGSGIEELKHYISEIMPDDESRFTVIRDLLSPSDIVVLVVPIDESAPKGRLILPQQQTIRDILEADAISVAVKENNLKDTLGSLKKKPRMVVTDSQVFDKVAADTPADIPLTSFSILFARYKGDLATLAEGAKAVEALKDGDIILIAEGCTHHKQTDDIGSVKIPRWLCQDTKKDLKFEFSSGIKYPDDLQKYALIVHCGACMLSRREMLGRIIAAKENRVPIVNYGVIIAYMRGILNRSTEMFNL
jgi:[FeFe] hydrogenase H-cluster maturation GTPase HydF